MSKLTDLRLMVRIGLGGAIAIALLTALVHPASQAQSSSNSVSLSPGFTPNPLEVKGGANGSIALQEIVNQTDSPTGQCTGFANTQPNMTLVLTTFFNSLSLVVISSEDTALAIQGPGGVWCNDDFQGKNPGVSGQWLPGTYKVWVSSYARGRRPAYTVRIAEVR
ncbi:hypothetical protein K9N68_11415 [Kovacikia minuta CCNUW1]|uniref:hypothetical protein n=1 Tax=Kovacikia minuta TaxID=2931930 RepID=UPI001CC9D51A|nr:hypothetical protein [Kovacikia minuta]UBF28419.1 hypothetical protein K9N68_11415 [Kovacikia minuta CCNUW1]